MKLFCILGVVVFLTVGFAVKADVPALGNTTNSTSGFTLGTFNDYTAGWAVGFTPTESINVSSVTLWLKGYDAQFVNQLPSSSFISLELNENGNPNGFNQPTFPVGTLGSGTQFTTPGTNDGSAAAFTFTCLPGLSINLDAGQEYWIFAYGLSFSPGGFPTVPLPQWISGGELTGANYDGLDSFFDSGFSPVSNDGTDIPAFTINVVPEPGVTAFASLTLLLGIGRVVGKRIKNRA